MYFIEGQILLGVEILKWGQIIKGVNFFIGRGQKYFIEGSNFNRRPKYYKVSNIPYLNYGDLLSLS